MKYKLKVWIGKEGGTLELPEGAEVIDCRPFADSYTVVYLVPAAVDPDPKGEPAIPEAAPLFA